MKYHNKQPCIIINFKTIKYYKKFQSQQAFQSLAAEDILSSRGLYENATTSSSIFLFGNFEVIDNLSKDLFIQ